MEVVDIIQFALIALLGTVCLLYGSAMKGILKILERKKDR